MDARTNVGRRSSTSVPNRCAIAQYRRAHNHARTGRGFDFKDRLKRHGIKPIRWHALRRVFAAILQAEGIPLESIRDLMGHSELRVTEGYAYVMPDNLVRGMRAVDDVLGANWGTSGVRRNGDAPRSPKNNDRPRRSTTVATFSRAGSRHFDIRYPRW